MYMLDLAPWHIEDNDVQQKYNVTLQKMFLSVVLLIDYDIEKISLIKELSRHDTHNAYVTFCLWNERANWSSL